MTSASPTPDTREEQWTLLLVDDVPDNLLALEAALAPLGHRTVRANSGEEALRHLLREEDFAVIILDVQMPGMDGFATAQAIRRRERNRDVPILFLTAINRDEQHRLEGFAAGAADYIFKPIDPELLRAKVSVFVRIHAADRRLQRQQEELRRQAAELVRSNADLDQFASVVSHDLMEPLRVITGHIELLRERLGDQLDERTQVWMDRIDSCAVRMTDLVENLLSYSRATALADGSTRVSSALSDAVADALENLHAAISESGAKVSVDPDLPVLCGTRRELAQVIQNLVANSIRHHGDSPPVVTIESVREGDTATVRVSDDGPGLDPAQMERVFGVFERSRNQLAPSSGLGLAICRRIVTRLGGTIWMEPNTGGGVSVCFNLPRADID